MLNIVRFEHEDGSPSAAGPRRELWTFVIEGAPKSLDAQGLRIALDVAVQHDARPVPVTEMQLHFEQRVPWSVTVSPTPSRSAASSTNRSASR